MKTLDIAWKDIKHAFRSAFSLFFMFGVPVLVTGLFFMMFGGLSGDQEFTVPQTNVQAVNQDEGLGDFNMGAIIIDVLKGDNLSDVVALTEASDPASAKQSVDDQEAGVAIIIPADFTAAVFDNQGRARTEIELYQDPTLTLGPSIVKMIIQQFMDSFSGTRIAFAVAEEQFSAASLQLTNEQVQSIVEAHMVWTQEQGGAAGEDAGAIAVESPETESEANSESQIAAMLGIVQVGMMVFYAFFTATASAQTILQEDEEGTLPRLFTTPTTIATVLRGKFLANGLTILVQVLVLVTFGYLVFGISYGDPAGIALATLGTVMTATTFGIFVISWMRDTQQAGLIYGGVLVVTGMLGIVESFTAGTDAGRAMEVLPLLVPQGWVYQLWQAVREEALASQLLLYVGGLAVWSLVFFTVGRMRFRRRFA